MVAEAVIISIAAVISSIISGTLIEVLRKLRGIDDKLGKVELNCQRLNHMSEDIAEVKIRIMAIENATTNNRS